MCRSIVRLREGSEVFDRVALEAAALQYVRKVSGFREPSPVNRQAFDDAVRSIADATERLMGGLALR